ncbi:hornerin-like [Argiope bruennichi]|uniref:hornerin-like n=1 Tax=Argiope bruennichi TaxID=94029 RepID=UPI0024952ADD|nr:hornerin-like [Argiope bruennichi]
MSLPERYSCKLLVLLYLSACIIAVAKAGTNETSTTTTTAKPEASLPEAESSLVETSVNLEGQETRTKSASHGYSESGKSYLPQESIYHSYPHEEQVYEYGKRIAGPYKGNIDSIYHAQQEQAHYPQSEYIDSHRHYEQQQLDDYGHSSGKGIGYQQVKIHDDSYGKEHLDDYGHSSGKGTPYQQVKVQADSYGKDDYGHSDGKGIAYSQVKIQGDSYGKKFDDYGHSIDKGTPYPHGKSQDDSYGKEHVDDYGHSSGKGISYQHAKIQDDSYGKEHLDDYGHSSGKGTPYQQEHLDDYGHSSGKGSQYQQEHLDDYGHSSGKGTPYQQEHLDDYGHSSGKGTPYQQEHLDAYGHSSGKGTPYQQVKIQADSYGKEDYGKHGKSYSNHKSVDDTKAPYLKYSYEVPKKQYVSGDHYDVKDYGGSVGYGSEDNGYHGKSHDEGAYGKGGSKGYSNHESKSNDYSSGGHDYSSGGKVSHFPVIPKESGYVAGGHNEPEYLHQSPKGSVYQHEAGYHSESGSSVGIPHSEIKQEKVAVFIKQIGHSKDGHEYGKKHGERHGYLLLPVVPGKADDKIKIETTGGYGGLDYKSIAQDYVQKPISENDGKYSYSSYFKTGAAAYGTSSGKSAYDGNSKSAYGGHPKSTIIPHGGHAKSEVFSYGGDSKSHYDEKENYNHGGHSYEPQYEKESSYGHAPVAQYHKEPLIYEGGKSSSAHVSDYGINGNAKYINAQEYGHQKSYGKGGETSYEAAIPHKGASYGKEGPSIDVHSYSSGHPSSKGSYDGITVVKSSSAGYGKRHNSGPVKGKGYSQGHGYENQKSYGAEVVSPYVASSGEKYSQQGKGFPAVSYGSFTPIINPYGSVVDFSRSASKKSVSSKSHGSGYKSAGLQDGYGHSKQSSSYRRPKSFAVILQRAHGGHSDSYGSPSYSANIKGGSKSLSHGYSEQGFKPIIPKHGGISEYYNLHSYGSSPRYSAIPHPKSSSRKN